MGHERVGILCKSARWTRLVHQMGGFLADEVPVGALAAQTLQNVRWQYETLFQDDAVKSAFAFLVKFAHACRSHDPHEALKASGISMAEKTTLLSIVRTLKEQIHQQQAATEYGQLTICAAADAIGHWYKQTTNLASINMTQLRATPVPHPRSPSSSVLLIWCAGTSNCVQRRGSPCARPSTFSSRCCTGRLRKESPI